MDKPGYTGNRIFNWGMEILSMITTVLSLFFDFKGILPEFPWQFIAMGATVLFVVFAFRHIISLEGDLFSKVPRVILVNHPYLENVQMNSGKPIIISAKGDTVNRNISRFLKIAFANAPKHNTENNHARRITAKLTYSDKNGNILVGPIYARWSLSDPPKTRDDLKKLIFYELDSSGKIEPIDIAFKIDSEGVCYAYNNDCYFESDLKKPDFELKSEIIDVKIELRGERVTRRKFKLRFFNDGKDTPIRIEEHKSLPRRLFHKTDSKQ